MPNPRLKLMPLPNPMLMLMLGDTTVVLMDTDTMAIPTVISAKDLLMPNLRLRPNPGEDIIVVTDTAVPTVITDTDTVILARGPLMPKPNPRPNPGDTTAVDTDTADTDMVDTVDTIMVELLKTPLKLPSGSSHSNSFNLATIPSIF